MVGGYLEFEFTENKHWRENITEITGSRDNIEPRTLDRSYIIKDGAGALGINHMFFIPGKLSITIRATGYDDVFVEVEIEDRFQ